MEINKTEIKINGNTIKKFNLNIGSYNTNKKITIYETETELYLKSYESIILVYDKIKNIIIYDYETYKTSVTTRKHLTEFLYYLTYKRNYNIKHEIYLTEYKFYKDITENFYNFGNNENMINHYYKNYNLEKNHIKSFMNYKFTFETLTMLNLKNEPNNNYFLGFKHINTIKKELKTRNKYLIGFRYNDNTENKENPFKTEIILILTLDKKETKLLNYKIELVSKIGLSYNNYNTKELDNYTNYYCY